MRKKVKKNKYKGQTLLDRLPENHGEWLLLCIKYTDRAITHPEAESQKFLIDQKERIESQLEEWKKANPGSRLRNL